MRRLTITAKLFLVFWFYSEQLNAQNDAVHDLDYRPVRLTLLPGVGTNGLDAHRYTARYSLNFLAGYHGGLDGVELGLVNVTRRHTRGLQAGLVNATGGNSRGLKLAAFINASNGGLWGMQLSSLVNFSRRDVQGFQITGLANISGSIQGLQISGFGNFSTGTSRALQIASVMNISRRTAQGVNISGGLNFSPQLQGISIASFLNLADEAMGLQFSGIANISRRAQGIQIGLFNTAREFRGIPAGLISWYGNGRKNIDISFSDGGFTQIGLKTGTNTYYNTLSVGYNTFITDRDVWRVSWTIGSYRELSEWWEDSRFANFFRKKDFSIIENQEGNWLRGVNRTLSYRYMLGRNIIRGMSFYAGPSLNLQITNEEEASEYTWYSIFEGERAGREFRFWIGFSAGLHFF